MSIEVFSIEEFWPLLEPGEQERLYEFFRAENQRKRAISVLVPQVDPIASTYDPALAFAEAMGSVAASCNFCSRRIGYCECPEPVDGT